MVMPRTGNLVGDILELKKGTLIPFSIVVGILTKG